MLRTKVDTLWRSYDPQNKPNWIQSHSKEVIIISVALGLLGTGLILFNLPKLAQEKPTETTTKTPEIRAVTALGRIEPQGEVAKIAATPNLGGAKIMQVLVEPGEIVSKGQLLAILDNYQLQKAYTAVATQEVEVQRSNLEIVRAGVKEGEINSQKAVIERLKVELEAEGNRTQAEIARWEAELTGERVALSAALERLKAEYNNASLEFSRYQGLATDGAISTSELDQRRLTLDTASERVQEAEANLLKTTSTLEQSIKEAQANSQRETESLIMQIKEAEATLAQISEIRAVDVTEAQAKLDKAIAESNRAEEELALSEIRAPFAGRVLKINTRPGENIDQEDGVLELGKTDQMMVIAEVHESNISRVAVGQEVIITSEGGSFDTQLKGTVTEIGWQIGKNDVLNSDPAADVDKRVIEVKILLDPQDSQKVQNLTYSQVFVEIKI
jgi:HlyD family secretion protein